MKLQVTTYEIIRRDCAGFAGADAYEFEAKKVINYSNSSDRKWLSTHMHWAFHNNRRIELHPESF